MVYLYEDSGASIFLEQSIDSFRPLIKSSCLSPFQEFLYWTGHEENIFDDTQNEILFLLRGI